MDLNNKLCRDKWTDISSSGNQLPKIPPDHQSFTNFNSQQHQNKWEDPSIIDYNTRIEQQFPEFNQQSEPQSSVSYNADSQPKINDARDPNKTQDWDPKTMLTNLSLLEDKIHQLQGLVHMIVSRRGPLVGPSNELVYQQQQLITADLTSIIVQLISTAGSLLPSVKHALSSLNPSVSSLGPLVFPSGAGLNNGVNEIPQNNNVKKVEEDYHNGIDMSGNCGAYTVEEHESKDEDDNEEGENLPPGSYEILQLEKEEILAPHTHFCTICGKGFKRDANLRMHMRGHGDEYKTPAALAKPHKESSSTEPLLVKRYSCPYVGCKRNRDHKKFQPLKTILCVKNHYKRTHCDKSYTCSRCHTKKFSVLADLKTHEKHCGRDKWLCSCGTTFSRKDKLFGHITLFQGHTPAIPTDPAIGSACGPSDCGESDEAPKKVARFSFNFGSNGCNEISGVHSEVDFKEGVVDDLAGYFSPLNFDTCSLTGFQDFPRAPFEDVESSLSFLLSGSCNYTRKSGGESGSNNQE